jgi:hypothetical protein
MIYNISVVNKNENCTLGYSPYKLMSINTVGNVCFSNNVNGFPYLEFKKECLGQTFALSQELVISSIYDTKICHRELPESHFTYYFKVMTDRCNTNDLECGNTGNAIVCLVQTADVKICPFINLILTSETAGKNILLKEKVDGINNLYGSNIVTRNIWYLSFNINFVTYKNINFYDYLDTLNEPQNITSLYTSYIYDYPTSTNLELNTFSPDYFSDKVRDGAEYSFYKFYKIHFTDAPFTLNLNDIDYDLSVKFRGKYITLPNNDCINYYFLNSTNDNNTRGYFAVLSDISFSFMNSAIIQYNTWCLLQLATFVLYFYYFRMKTINDKINNIHNDINMKTEKITTLLLIGFNILVFVLRILLFIIMKNNFDNKLSFIKDLIDKKCFKKIDNLSELPDSLIHLNLYNFINSIMMTELKTKIFYIQICLSAEGILHVSNLVCNLFTKITLGL